MFSTFYLALFLMLVALILRGVAFELRTKEKCPCWQKTWDAAIFIGSIVPAFLWGVAVTDLAAGLPISANMVYQGNFLDLLYHFLLQEFRVCQLAGKVAVIGQQQHTGRSAV